MSLMRYRNSFMTLLFGLPVCWLVLGAFPSRLPAEMTAEEPVSEAPFSNETALRKFSDALVKQIGGGAIDLAETTAIANSHLDDEVAQRNIAETFDLLPTKLDGAETFETKYVQMSKFGRSFIRHQYAFENGEKSLRCMLTYRRKTDGWRLNQLWCF